MAATPRVRIAPSPTGDPHVGTAYVALFNRAFADATSGRFLLRIDDTDRTRYSEGSDRAIFRALEWLGISWDEGPEVGGEFAPYRQSERTELYRRKTDELIERGAAYRCFCTPERLAELRESQKGSSWQGYDRHCRDLDASEIDAKLAARTRHVVRLKVPTAGTTEFTDLLRGTVRFDNANIDDQVLMKSDGYPTYHMANCVDDSTMGITHVMRAEEWITSTPKHVLIYAALGEELPIFAHVPLLRNADKSKISKRKNPVSLNYYRERGYLPEAMKNFLATLGWSAPDEREIFDYAYFVAHFRPQDISLGGPVFDLEKLKWMNGMHIRALPLSELRDRLTEEGFLDVAGVTPEGFEAIFPIVAERMHLLSDFTPLTRWFFAEPDAYEPEDLLFKKTTADQCVAALRAVAERIDAANDWSVEAIDALLESLRVERDLKKPQLFMPIRIALTGRRDAPPVGELIEVLGRDRVGRRLRAAADRLDAAS